jgi:hypothetical protein
MPHATWDDICRTSAQLDDSLSLLILQDNVNRAREEHDEFITGRMPLPRWPIAGLMGDTDEPPPVQGDTAGDLGPEAGVYFHGYLITAVCQVHMGAEEIERRLRSPCHTTLHLCRLLVWDATSVVPVEQNFMRRRILNA